MKVFLTGATGFVGKHMLERLLSEGHAVRAALRGLPGQKARVVAHTQSVGRKDDFQWVYGDVVEGARLDRWPGNQLKQGPHHWFTLITLIENKMLTRLSFWLCRHASMALYQCHQW